MSGQMKFGDAVLVRATFDDCQDDGSQVWVRVALAEREGCLPYGDAPVLRSQLTTEEAIRTAERRRTLLNVATLLRSKASLMVDPTAREVAYENAGLVQALLLDEGGAT